MVAIIFGEVSGVVATAGATLCCSAGFTGAATAGVGVATGAAMTIGGTDFICAVVTRGDAAGAR